MLRMTTALALCFALPALAEDFDLSSHITQAEIFPQGAMIERAAEFDLPAGTHQLTIADLPGSVPMDALRITAPGLTIDGIALDQLIAPPAADTPEQAAARAALDAAQAQLDAINDQISLVSARGRAAHLALAALENTQLSTIAADQIASYSQALRDAAGDASAELVRVSAELRPLNLQAQELERAVEVARRALADQSPTDGPRGRAVISVSTDTPASGAITLRYQTTQARWEPSYDLHLDSQAGQVQLTRAALIRQTTGERWRDVAVTLSTRNPSGAMRPAQLWPIRRDLVEAGQAHMRESLAEAPMMAMADRSVKSAMPIAMPEVIEGLEVRYSYDRPLSLASNGSDVRIALGDVTLDAQAFVRAVPARDTTGFMAAKVTNSTDEPILPAIASLYLDGAFIGKSGLGPIAAGDETELYFGPVDGIQLHHSLRANEGARGLLGGRNERQEVATYRVENMTDRAWDIRLTGQVPYSEQDALTISYDASPAATVTDLDDQQGILEWRFSLPAQADKEISVTHTMRWPDDKELR